MTDERVLLEPKQMPDKWYNIAADLNGTLAMPLHPGTKEPVKPEDLAPIFPDELISQEMSSDRFIEIPEEVQDIYRMTRPTPLVRAKRLEKFLDTPARIYYKYEGVNPAGSHKTNTAIPQAYYNKKAGIKKLVTETGAGQWGSALAFACHKFGLECQVFMVKVSYEQKPYRKTFIQLFGGDIVASPSTLTNSGKAVLQEDPESPGSLGIAISEAVEVAAQQNDANYSLGSVLNHVMLHQTIIGEEARIQLEMLDEYPDIVIGCVGGGSNFAGISFSFLRDKLTNGNKNLEVIAVEPSSCPTLTKGKFDYDFGDQAGLTPLMKMYTLGNKFIPPKIHAGGLRYHGAAPTVSELLNQKIISAESFHQKEVFEAARIFIQTEGVVLAPESSHAVKSVIEQANKCKSSGESKSILFNLSGHGLLDLGAYDSFLSNKLED
ncbi:TrpB-like pyridoxal phosphate-dependent enzyme [Bacteroidota bacterium]